MEIDQDALRADIQEQVKKLQQGIDELCQEFRRDVYMAINEMALISQLPDEVLLEIFFILKDTRRVQEWIRVTHVCRRWRDVGVGAPMLWTTPLTKNHDLTTLMLTRSAQADLIVDLDSSLPTNTVESLFNCIGRIKTLRILQGNEEDGDEPDSGDYQRTFPINRLLEAALTRVKAARLQSLNLSCKSKRYLSSGTSILQHIGPAGQLRELRLINTLVNWDIFPMRNLTQLHFTVMPAPLPISTYLHILRQMPLLEKLTMPLHDNMLVITASATPSKVMLPLLHYLNILHGSPRGIGHFLTHVELPQLRQLFFDLWYSPQFEESVESSYPIFIQAIIPILSGGSFGLFEEVSIVKALFQIARARTSPTLNRRHPLVQIMLRGEKWRLLENGTPPLGTQLPMDMLQACPRSVLGCRRLDIWDKYTTEEFSQILGSACFSALESVRLLSSCQNISILVGLLDIGDDLDQSKVALPKLTSLHFNEIRFQPEDIQALCASLVSRKRAGLPLKVLTFRKCTNITPTVISDFEEAVVHLSYIPPDEETALSETAIPGQA